MDAANAETGKLLMQYGESYSVYQADIDRLEQEYIDGLVSPDQMQKTATASGLFDYIYNNYLKDIIINNLGNSHNAYDYNALDMAFNNIYIPLCAKYSLSPTVIQFSCMVGISNDYLTYIKSGQYHEPRGKVNPALVSIVKGWYARCEAGLNARAINDNSVGAIFALKAGYGYVEAAQKLEIVTGEQPATPKEIAARYESAKPPELPDIETEKELIDN